MLPSMLLIKLAGLFGNIENKIHTFLVSHNKIPVCHGFDGPCFRKGSRRKQNTKYVENERNYVFLCDKCMKYNDEFWNEMWDDLIYGVI